MPMRMTWEIFRQNVYVWFASAAIASQFTTNSDGGYGRAQRISTFELHSKHLMDDPERSKKKTPHSIIVEFLNFIGLVFNS